MRKKKQNLESSTDDYVDYKTGLVVDNSEPEYCKKEYIEDICNECPYRETKPVPHPGGDSRYTTESYWCDWGYWEDDF